MQEIKMGVIGGCLASLNNVGKSDLFYVKIRDYFKEDYKINFSLGSYNNISEIKDEIIRLKNKKNINYLLLQIRPDVYLRNCKIYLKTSKGNFLNPLFINKENYIKIEESEKRLNTAIHERINPKILNMKDISILKKYFSFYNLNLFFGFIFGIDKTMKTYYLKNILEINELCIKNDIKLIIHGPVPRVSYKMEPILINRLSKYLEKELKDICLYIKTNDILYENEDVLFEDKMHVNSNGHKMLANKIIYGLKQNYAF